MYQLFLKKSTAFLSLAASMLCVSNAEACSIYINEYYPKSCNTSPIYIPRGELPYIEVRIDNRSGITGVKVNSMIIEAGSNITLKTISGITQKYI